MYIEITIDVKNYINDVFDLRLSDYHSVKKVIDIVWQMKSISESPRDGYWVRVTNKQLVLSGNERLVDCGITTGDRLEII